MAVRIFNRWTLPELPQTRAELVQASHAQFLTHVRDHLDTGRGVTDVGRETIRQALRAPGTAEAVGNAMVRALALGMNGKAIGSNNQYRTTETTLADALVVTPNSLAARVAIPLSADAAYLVHVDQLQCGIMEELSLRDYLHLVFHVHGLSLAAGEFRWSSGPKHGPRRFSVGSVTYMQRLAAAVFGANALHSCLYPGEALPEEIYVAHLLGCQIVGVGFDGDFGYYANGIDGYWHDIYHQTLAQKRCTPMLRVVASRIGLALQHHYTGPERNEWDVSEHAETLKTLREALGDLDVTMDPRGHESPCWQKRLCAFLNEEVQNGLPHIDSRWADTERNRLAIRTATAIAFLEDCIAAVGNDVSMRADDLRAMITALQSSTLEQQFHFAYGRDGVTIRPRARSGRWGGR